MDWKFNCTGVYIKRLAGSERVIRQRHGNAFLYKAEDWGDYSLRFPVTGGWAKTLAGALRALRAIPADERRVR